MGLNFKAITIKLYQKGRNCPAACLHVAYFYTEVKSLPLVLFCENKLSRVSEAAPLQHHFKDVTADEFVTYLQLK